MLKEIKSRIEKELKNYIDDLDKIFSLNSISPLIFRNIKEFVLRQGKRIRPVLFVISYLGFAKRTVQGLYRSAVSLELLHDFMLVHDDIIDKSSTRRGLPSMHVMLEKCIKNKKNIKFDGKDLAIVIGDVMFALSLHSFLSIKEDMQRKESALKKLIEAAIYTGSGEFIELILGAKDINEVSKKEIYKIYDFKTASYTFAYPLSIGATIAGAKNDQINTLFEYGIYLGRAFQIKDDIIGLFQEESEIGKPNLTDIQESKKTILIWYAYNHSDKKTQSQIKTILSKPNADKSDLLKMRQIIINSKALDYAKKQIKFYINKASLLNKKLKMSPLYKNLLEIYSHEILKI